MRETWESQRLEDHLILLPRKCGPLEWNECQSTKCQLFLLLSEGQGKWCQREEDRKDNLQFLLRLVFGIPFNFLVCFNVF